MSGSAENIVVRGVNWLGDAVMTTPALLRLREAKPNARITILTPEKLTGLWKHHPAINDVIAFTKDESAWHIGRRLRWGNFTHGIIFPNSPRSAIELWLGSVPNRIGYSRPWRNFFLTQAVGQRPNRIAMRKRTAGEVKALIESSPANQTKQLEGAHQVYDYLHLVAALGANPCPIAPRLTVTDEEVRNYRRGLLKDTDQGTEIFLGINPGAEYGPAKRWPKDRFIETAVAVQRQINCRWLIFGGNNDLELAEEIANSIRAQASSPERVVNLAGKTTLRDLCVALKVCRVVLTNDTGPAHVAAAVGTPVVIPFGSTSPELTAPGFGTFTTHRFLRSDVPCAPCFLRECPIDFRCMNSITTDSVIGAVLDAAKNL